jgi:phosphate transport system substrate-binding protein
MIKKIVLSLVISMMPVAAVAQITGAGATFPYPIYSKWAEEYKRKTDISINYQSIGSGAGIKQVQNKTITFGATDMPLSQDELEKGGLVQFPMVIGSVVIGYNFKDNNKQLTPQEIVDLYLGNTKKLDDQNVVIVRRSDGSGTTYLFTNWLSSISVPFKNKVGVGTAVNWPTGIGAKGNEGVTNNIKLAKGAIGYVEYAYAKQNDLRLFNLNIDGKIIKPNMESFKNGSWPVTSPTYILMRKNSEKPEDAKKAVDFFLWAMKHGDKMVEDLEYIPLSTEQKNHNIQILESIKIAN